MHTVLEMPTAVSTTQPVIVFEDVGVRYRVPRERLSGIKEYAIRWLQRRIRYEEFWGLRNISFTIRKGEKFGVIGHNGAGKSTLLKVVARVLHPTEGRVMMRGTTAPLLELGAGFNEELTGRENIFLNGALLGHTRTEMNDLIPSILDFAEVGDFIDAPIRTYSSGMMARLGFAVATSVRPDLLLVDEVLSVGDGQFQDKCVERMKGFVRDGTTIMLVSHDLGTVKSFCERVMWLDHGHMKAIGPADEVVDQYMDANRELH